MNACEEMPTTSTSPPPARPPLSHSGAQISFPFFFASDLDFPPLGLPTETTGICPAAFGKRGPPHNSRFSKLCPPPPPSTTPHSRILHRRRAELTSFLFPSAASYELPPHFQTRRFPTFPTRLERLWPEEKAGRQVYSLGRRSDGALPRPSGRLAGPLLGHGALCLRLPLRSHWSRAVVCL